jgi:hypothetical protein
MWPIFWHITLEPERQNFKHHPILSAGYIVNGISGLAKGGYGPLVNTGKLNTFKLYYTHFNTFSLL